MGISIPMNLLRSTTIKTRNFLLFARYMGFFTNLPTNTSLANKDVLYVTKVIKKILMNSW